ncbi:phosphate binding protein [Rippkaea orientalis PCC 8801]|uniref:Phosphate-binding protein n=1 Tax=Rippkaea orientalis (strain PCC 8801 / RF-1) TaxID=41431 RepID=B7K5V0_RIPO1|nr:PstS family phosphate ABC transporter substrate-binding protein [Rippkaea orientalis]ACK68003.1 phosphate binding protein [Rippkaea orientalis PCC 8801]
MKQIVLNSRQFVPSWLLSLGIGIGIVSCGSPELPESITIDGSSTVYPITQAVVESYKQTAKNPVTITLSVSGTGGGFREFCEGKTDISNASRPILREEMTLCNRNNVRYIELPIAFDALTVVVNPQNTWLDTITTEELKRIWQPEAGDTITRWNQIRQELPNQPLNLYGPGIDSGTYDYFTEAIVGKAHSSRLDYFQSENDEIIVAAVKQDPNALGYFGLAYYEAHAKELKALAIDNGKGAVAPSRESVETAQYQPLARPLFIYVNLASAQNNTSLREFIDFYLAQAPTLVPKVGYIPLPQEAYQLDKITFHKGEAGTVFEGKSEFNLTIPELLRKQAQF